MSTGSSRNVLERDDRLYRHIVSIFSISCFFFPISNPTIPLENSEMRGVMRGRFMDSRHSMALIFNSFDGFCSGRLMTHPKTPFFLKIITIGKKEGVGKRTT
ncbi:hypothetical protein L1887_18115 [Cichorium endivia]|nr:hypothetical protein L1887_18115 [Cichorium endivia]